MKGKSLALYFLIIFLFLWTLSAVNTLYNYQQQKQAIENNIQNRVQEITGRENNSSLIKKIK